MMRLGIVVGLLLTCASVFAAEAKDPPAAETGMPRERTESLSKWQWCFTVSLPEKDASPWGDFLLTPKVFEKARADLADLRLAAAEGREVPFALRIRHDQNKRENLEAREFNRQKLATGAVELSLDLGENPAENEQIVVNTSGDDYRRRIQLEGSQDGQRWGDLASGWLVSYQVESQHIDIHKLNYPSSRFRYLRVRISPDASKEGDRPEIASVHVIHNVQVPGEFVTLPAQLDVRQAVPAYEGPGSAWIIDLGAEQTPCERLTLDVYGEEFSRPFALEQMDESGTHWPVARGELRRRAGSPREPLTIKLDREVCVRRLRLVVTDYRNPPLNIVGVQFTAPAREVVFARKTDLAGPLRLYVGNAHAEAPKYDFEASLPVALSPPPARASLGEATANPEYTPDLPPLTERWPWLPYVVLGCASVVLLGMLVALGRAAIRRHDGGQATS